MNESKQKTLTLLKKSQTFELQRKKDALKLFEFLEQFMIGAFL